MIKWIEDNTRTNGCHMHLVNDGWIIVRISLDDIRDRPVKLADVKEVLRCGYDTARKHIKLLEEKKWLHPKVRGLRGSTLGS
jgi:hypothetical protein